MDRLPTLPPPWPLKLRRVALDGSAAPTAGPSPRCLAVLRLVTEQIFLNPAVTEQAIAPCDERD